LGQPRETNFYNAANAPKNRAMSPPSPPTTVFETAAAFDEDGDATGTDVLTGVKGVDVIVPVIVPVPACVAAAVVEFHIVEIGPPIVVSGAATLLLVAPEMAVRLALYSLQRLVPTAMIVLNRLAGHAESKQVATTFAMLSCAGPH
jgi:hypothetical protein